MTTTTERMKSRARITAAAQATSAIDGGGLWDALTRLQRVGGVGNGAGVYADVRAVRSALADAAAEIKRAQEIMGATDWPTEADYDAA